MRLLANLPPPKIRPITLLSATTKKKKKIKNKTAPVNLTWSWEGKSTYSTITPVFIMKNVCCLFMWWVMTKLLSTVKVKKVKHSAVYFKKLKEKREREIKERLQASKMIKVTPEETQSHIIALKPYNKLSCSVWYATGGGLS